MFILYPSPDPVVSVCSPPWQPETRKADYPRCLGIRATAFILYKVQRATAKRIRRYFDERVFCKILLGVQGDNRLLKAILV